MSRKLMAERALSRDHIPMKYVVYDIIESQAGAGALFIGAAVDVGESTFQPTSLSSSKVLLP